MTPDTDALRALADAALGGDGLAPGIVRLDPDTVLALCDAADEVERLRANCDELREQVQRLRASRESNRGGWERTLVERDALRAAVDRVRALGERDGRDRLAAWFASNGVDQPDTVAVEAAAFVLAALESGNYGTPEWFSSIEKPLFGRAADAEGLAGVTVIRCPECDAGEPCQMVRESSAIARPETGDGAEDAPCPMRDEPAPSSDDPHGAYSRVLVGMAVERDKARSSAAAASERHEDDIRRLLDCREVVRSLTAERDASRTEVERLREDVEALHGLLSAGAIGTAPGSDSHRMVLAQRNHYKRQRDASRTAHAALVAELRALCDDSDHGWVHRRAVLARLDRHAPTTGETP